VIKQEGEQWRFTPEFFVDYKGFKVNAPEIAGTNQFGGSLNISLPFQSKDALAGGNPRLVGRSQALGLITLGLAHYAFEDYDQAKEFFTRALATEGWLEEDGKEVAYLLRGNATAMQASVQKTQQGVDESLADYEQALRIKPNYGRALLGKGGAIYQQAFRDPAHAPSADNLDPDLLSRAEQIFQQVLALTDQPLNADLPAKAHFALGQAYETQAEFGDTSLPEKAHLEYQQVVDEYKRQIAANPEEPSAIELIAGHAYARLGLLSVVNGGYFEAEDDYRQAIQLVGPTYKAIYTANLGEALLIHSQVAVDNHDMDTARAKLKEAIQAYKQAIDLAGSANVDSQKLIQRFTARQAELEGMLQSLQ
jgi:tetratricopeptide (TPR) repeat protein